MTSSKQGKKDMDSVPGMETAGNWAEMPKASRKRIVEWFWDNPVEHLIIGWYYNADCQCGKFFGKRHSTLIIYILFLSIRISGIED